ncbi:MAG: Na+/H+ antiporter [Chitinophagaceae bacterium]
MHHLVLIVIALLFVVLLLVMVAQKLRIAFPIFLVLAGLGISLIPGIPTLSIDPDVIFLIFLPPLLYEAAWYTSWQDFWRWRRSIGLLAFGLVFFTAAIVAYTAYNVIPGCTLALGFLLGGIVSPPDAVAAATVMKGLGVPKRLLAILEGESLINDASSLIVYRFALLAVLSETFSLHQAIGSFFLVAGMGIVVGVAIGLVMGLIHRYLPTTSAMNAALTFLTPYLTYLIAEQLGFSGVMATVTAGLLVSYHAPRIFRTGDTRVNMLGVWTTLIFVLNALVFILIGLELPAIVHGLGTYRLKEGIEYGLLMSAVVIVVRFVWVYASAFMPGRQRAEARREPSLGWRGSLVTSWAGMRGVVSLATALSIPMVINDQQPFPLRNLILFITFVVIFVTLVFQGLTLPWIIKLIGLKQIDEEKSEEEQLFEIRKQLDDLALARLDKDYFAEVQTNQFLFLYRNNLANSMKFWYC